MFSLIPWRRETRAPAVAEGPLARFPDEFGSLFDRIFGRMLPPEALPRMEWFGGDESEEKENEVLLKVALPDFELAELEIFVNTPYLIIKAEHKVEPKEEGKEPSYRTFRETLTLPPEVEPEKIEAFYRNGVLEIHLPKAEAPKGKKVEVKG